jgi:hypothetical protein
VRQVTASLAQVPYAHVVEVNLHVSLAEASRRIPPYVATLTETPAGVLLLRAVARTVLAHGSASVSSRACS